MKKLLLFFWNLFWDFFYQINFSIHCYLDSVYSFYNLPPIIYCIEETINLILSTHCSIARYGDGEIKLCNNKDLGFQHADPELCTRLRKILLNDINGLLVCVPDVFGSLETYLDHDRKHWTKHLAYFRRSWYRFMNRDQQYGDAFISRFYMPYKDKSIAVRVVNLWKQVWNERDLLIVEGEKSRLGVGNNLFDNARNIKRILAPNIEAFVHCDAILAEVQKYDRSQLVLLALGPTATVLAADLCILGYQAIDIGHIDIEYEWMRMGADHKVPVTNKFVNEAGGGKGVGESDDERYLMQIVKTIGC